jgi:hypothetical protein
MLRTTRFATTIGLSGGVTIGNRGESAGISRRARAGALVFGLLLGAVLALTAGARPVAAADTLFLNELGYVHVPAVGGLCGGRSSWMEDYLFVRVDLGAVDPNYIQIVLQTPPWITWWKGIEVEEAVPTNVVVGCSFGSCPNPREFRLIAALWTQDYYHGPYAVNVPVSRLRGDNGAGPGRLRFGKAKLFGVHTGMYDVSTTIGTQYGWCQNFVPGARYTFNWMDD